MTFYVSSELLPHPLIQSHPCIPLGQPDTASIYYLQATATLPSLNASVQLHAVVWVGHLFFTLNS